MSWTTSYIGIPQADKGRSKLGCDCWGLAWLVYGQELGLQLPSYVGAYVSADEAEEVAAIIRQEEQAGLWRVADQAAPFNLLVFRSGRYRRHIGIRVDSRFMLHMDGVDQSRLTDLRDARWRNRLINEVRHIGLERAHV